MSKLHFLGVFLLKEVELSFIFFSFSEVVLHKVRIRRKIQYFFSPSFDGCHINNIASQQLYLYAAADKMYVLITILAPSSTASQSCY